MHCRHKRTGAQKQICTTSGHLPKVRADIGQLRVETQNIHFVQVVEHTYCISRICCPTVVGVSINWIHAFLLNDAFQGPEGPPGQPGPRGDKGEAVR